MWMNSFRIVYSSSVLMLYCTTLMGCKEGEKQMTFTIFTQYSYLVLSSGSSSRSYLHWPAEDLAFESRWGWWTWDQSPLQIHICDRTEQVSPIILNSLNKLLFTSSCILMNSVHSRQWQTFICCSHTHMTCPWVDFLSPFAKIALSLKAILTLAMRDSTKNCVSP